MAALRQREKERSLPAGLPVNPPGTLLGVENAVLTGTNNRYFVPEFEGSLSVKTVVRGSALWKAGGRKFKVHENCYPTLNDRQRYTLTIDSLQNATTFCLFFERGFVEDVLRATTMPAAGLLDAPQPARPLSVQFAEKLEPGDDRVMAMVNDLDAGGLVASLSPADTAAAIKPAGGIHLALRSARLACGQASYADF